MMAKLIGDPYRERDPETVNDGYDIVGDTDRLVWHVRMIRTPVVGVNPVGIEYSSAL